MYKTSSKRRRVLMLTWCIRNGIQVNECRQYLNDMGLNDQGIPLKRVSVVSKGSLGSL